MRTPQRIVMALSAVLGFLWAADVLDSIVHTQTLPAPAVDRVGFPSGYRDTYKLFYVFDNFQNRQIRAVWGNPAAASVTPGDVFNFPYGSIIVFESYSVQEDANGEPLLDKDGRFLPNALTTLFVMRKERGFGVDYKELRNGEWEYVAYRPDGTYSTQPSGTGSCAQCHKFGGAFASSDIGAQWDYVFRPDLYFGTGSGAVPKGVLQHYVFVPVTIHAQPGEVVTVYNSDQLLHRIVADDGSFDTGLMVPGSSFTIKAGTPGAVIAYHCTIHSRVKGQVVVDGAARGRLPIPHEIKPITAPTLEVQPILPVTAGRQP
jgi:plastocyanin